MNLEEFDNLSKKDQEILEWLYQNTELHVAELDQITPIMAQKIKIALVERSMEGILGTLVAFVFGLALGATWL